MTSNNGRTTRGAPSSAEHGSEVCALVGWDDEETLQIVIGVGADEAVAIAGSACGECRTRDRSSIPAMAMGDV